MRKRKQDETREHHTLACLYYKSHRNATTGINKKRMPKAARAVSPFTPILAASRDSSNLFTAGLFICPSDA